MRKEVVMRGKTASGGTEVINFSGHKKGYGYKMTEFRLYPTTITVGKYFFTGTLTAAKTAESVIDVNFNHEGLIGSTILQDDDQGGYEVGVSEHTVINESFMITQDLILMVQDLGGSSYACNWQMKFKSVKMTGPEEAAVNYNQFTISDG